MGFTTRSQKHHLKPEESGVDNQGDRDRDREPAGLQRGWDSFQKEYTAELCGPARTGSGKLELVSAAGGVLANPKGRNRGEESEEGRIGVISEVGSPRVLEPVWVRFGCPDRG